MIVIATVGGRERLYIKEALAQTIKEKYQVISFDSTITSVNKLTSLLVNRLKKVPQIVIVDIEGYNKEDFEYIGKLLEPDILVLSDINYSNIGLFKDEHDFIHARYELVKKINNKGVLIFNGDNKYVKDASNYFTGEKICYSKKAGNIDELRNEAKTKLVYVKNNAKGDLKLTSKDFGELVITKTQQKRLDSEIIIPSVLTLQEIGYTKDFLEKKQFIHCKWNLVSSFEGDEESLIIYNGEVESDYKSILEELTYADKIKSQGYFTKVIFATDGIDGLGKFNKKVSAKLTNELRKVVDILVTTDPLLTKFSLKDNIKTKIVKTFDTTDMLYTIRKNLTSRSILILEGIFASGLLETLRKEE